MGQQHEAQNTKADQVSGQIQSLNDSLDELKARLASIEKSINKYSEPAAIDQRQHAEHNSCGRTLPRPLLQPLPHA